MCSLNVYLELGSKRAQRQQPRHDPVATAEPRELPLELGDPRARRGELERLSLFFP